MFKGRIWDCSDSLFFFVILCFHCKIVGFQGNLLISRKYSVSMIIECYCEFLMKWNVFVKMDFGWYLILNTSICLVSPKDLDTIIIIYTICIYLFHPISLDPASRLHQCKRHW